MKPRDDDAVLQQLFDDAVRLEDALPKVEALQEIVRRADVRQLDDLSYSARIALMEVTLHLGRADILMVAFAWCLAKAESEPEAYDYTELLWRFRWAVVNMPSFPSISKAQIDAAITDMTRRYKAAGASMRAVHLLRWKVALGMLDHRGAADARRAWHRSASGWLCDDAETENATQLKYLLMRERWDEALAHAADYISGGRRSLAFEDSILSWMLVPLLRRERVAEAMLCYKRCVALTKGNLAIVIIHGHCMEFLALTYNFTQAIKILERHLGFCLRSDPEDQYEFTLAMLTLIRMLQQEGRTSVKLKLEPHVVGYQPSGTYQLAELERLYDAHVRALATQYDARNGNGEHTRLVNEAPALLQYAVNYPAK